MSGRTARIKMKLFKRDDYESLPPNEGETADRRGRGKCCGVSNSGTVILSMSLLVLCIIVASVGMYLFYEFYSESPHHSPDNRPQCVLVEFNRFDCWPEMSGATAESCQQRGCCWKPSLDPYTSPYCFYPSNYNSYNATAVKETPTGLEATLERKNPSTYPRDVKVIKLKVEFQTNSRLRIRIYDPNSTRYEVPLQVPTSSTKASNPLYAVSITKRPFGITVTRKSTGEAIFNTTATAPLVFSDQFLQIATRLSTQFIYGMGEHRNSFHIKVKKWIRYVFWNRDDVPKLENNGYGSHPFYLNLEKGQDSKKDGAQNNAHGVFLLNSNAGEAAFQPTGKGGLQGAVTFRALGGILDFFVFMGPEPEMITQQLVDVIGRPYFPPFWSLGYQLCRWGYNTSAMMSKVITRNRNAEMPYDVQWNDIDYMSGNKDWTYDTTRFKELPEIVSDLHNHQQRYVIMADPAISSSKTTPGGYPPFDDGVKMDVFVKTSKGEILKGQVWPGETAFPDFFHPNAEEYWYKQAKSFHDKLSFDGLWIDMNEPSNFVSGSTTGCPVSTYNTPPYLPPSIDSMSLIAKTICMTATQSISLHYNVHNMYGWSQANVSRRVLNRLYGGKRSQLITRSSFPGSGVNTGHWLGDNSASFREMAFSIPGILNFNLFGIPQVGADICGFRGRTTNELCTRWTQLGAFYPFMRNHADLTSPDQDPASFPSPYQDHMRSALHLRYSLLAVLYTLFYEAHTTGTPIVRPLMFYYKNTELMHKQFLWGKQLLVSPVLTKGDTSVVAFLPNDVWYDFYNGTRMPKVGQSVKLDAPLDIINVHIRGGSILPLLPPTQRTDLSRKEKFEIVSAPDATGGAKGSLYWDDGESLDSVSSMKYTMLDFSMKNSNTFTAKTVQSGYAPKEGIRLGKLTVLDVQEKPGKVLMNGKPANFTYTEDKKILMLVNLQADLTKPLSISWK